METKTPVVKRHWQIIEDIKNINPHIQTLLMGDHVTALPEESMEKSKVDFILTGGDYDFLLLNLVKFLEGKESLEPGIWYRERKGVKNTGRFRPHHDINSLPFIDRELTKWWLYSEKNGNYKKTPGTYIMARHRFVALPSAKTILSFCRPKIYINTTHPLKKYIPDVKNG